MPYFKIIFTNPTEIGSLINTNKSFDIKRIKRFEKLSYLFKLFFELSKNRNIPLHKILSILYPNTFSSELILDSEEEVIKDIKIIEKEILKTNFLLSEFRFFTDYVLSETKKELENDYDLILPDRFKSHYFFETLEDCFDYHNQLFIDGFSINSYCTIIQVEFLQSSKAYKMDNNFLRDFQNHHTSLDYYNKAKKFLNQESSEKPLFEIIYQGEYKVIDNSITI